MPPKVRSKIPQLFRVIQEGLELEENTDLPERGEPGRGPVRPSMVSERKHGDNNFFFLSETEIA